MSRCHRQLFHVCPLLLPAVSCAMVYTYHAALSCPQRRTLRSLPAPYCPKRLGRGHPCTCASLMWDPLRYDPRAELRDCGVYCVPNLTSATNLTLQKGCTVCKGYNIMDINFSSATVTVMALDILCLFAHWQQTFFERLETTYCKAPCSVPVS